jgi:hypothetical protein
LQCLNNQKKQFQVNVKKMSKAAILKQNTPPLPTGSSPGIWYFSLPRLGSVHSSLRQARLLAQQIYFCGNGVVEQAQSIALHLLTAYLPLPLKYFYLLLFHFGRLSATLCLCLCLCLSLSFSSCTRHPAPVTEALRHAGPNRQGLKQLLAHYAQNPADSLKYRAACFLVENMRWHFGKKVTPSPNLWELFLLEDSLVRPWLQNSRKNKY